ncbi:hypothetical protein MJ1_0462 [Nanobdella aerobiophila]|uniref:Uncharacterized protein n=1 Tax=Nanobdella aerobiophila TaxID=2586965 RepID=A0A915SY89_9ARCH|nr:hypothetical protein [Nanobdella aerobiophila]BBL45620.1 hypothetical protein MJ1_0462 [Nanobdella aerobiophila]
MKARLFFEAFSNDKDKLIELLDKTLPDNISKFKNYQIIEKKTAEPIEKEMPTPDNKKINGWSSYLEVYADFKDFDSIIDFILFYTPSKIEVEDIRELKIVAKDQEVKYNKERINILLNQISQAIFSKVTAVANAYIMQAKKAVGNQQSNIGNTQNLTNLKLPK